MSTNGLDTTEDTEMADCDGEKVVTMMDVLQEQQDFEDDANAVLGASDDKDCTFSKGYIKRQAIYACLTCCSEAKEDSSKRAGVCLACSLNCHENHELIELYTKRNFRCDCGNSKFSSHPCQLMNNKTDINEENNYNQNFSGLYCTCHRPYPDPESTDEEEEMIQCVICEDWLHASHLEATVPAHDQYSEMICKLCMEKNEFLHDYSEFAVNILENEDVDVTNGSNIADSTLQNGDSESKANGNNECSIDEPQTKGESDVDISVTNKVENENRESSKEAIATGEATIATSNVSDETEQITENEEKKADNEVSQNENVESNPAKEKSSVMDAETSELKKEESLTDTGKESEVEKSITDTGFVDTATEVEKKHDDHELKAEEAKSNEADNDLQKKEKSDKDQQNNAPDVPESGSEESTNTDTVPPVNDNSSENKETSEVSVEGEDNKEIEAIDKLLGEDTLKDSFEKSDPGTNEENMETNDESTEQCNENEKKVSETQSERNDESVEQINEYEKKISETQSESNAESMEQSNDNEKKISDSQSEGNDESTEQSNENEEIISKTPNESNNERKEIEQTTEVKQAMEEVENIAEKEATSIEPDVTEKITDTEMNVDSTSKTETTDVATTGTEAASNGTDTEMNADSTSKTETTDVAATSTDAASNGTDIEINADTTSKTEITNIATTGTEAASNGTDIEMNADSTGKTETTDVATNGTEAVLNDTKENKRKLSIEEDEQAIVTTKKAKLEDSRSCARPKGVKRIFRGATFWGNNFRQKLCTCSECISMYKDLSVLFLIDPEDTVTAYEALGKARTDGAPATQYEKGLQALSSLDRIQQINALTAYNKMRDELLDFLKSFKDRKEVVKEEDIRAFFAGMKPTRESDGVYFCR